MVAVRFHGWGGQGRGVLVAAFFICLSSGLVILDQTVASQETKKGELADTLSYLTALRNEGTRGESESKTLAGNSKRGAELYQASCIVCHGPGTMGGVGPKLAGNPVLSNDQAFWKIVHEGRHVMPPLKRTVTDEQMTDVRAWLMSLPR
jgi:mono/diheme cytochrome c family protein